MAYRLIIGLIMHLMARFFALKTLGLLAKLADWADSLKAEDINKPIPDFEFEEINRIARHQQSSFTKITQLIEKEKSFLRHASHELRTPIALCAITESCWRNWLKKTESMRHQLQE